LISFSDHQASGVAVSAECKEAFENVKKGKMQRYIIFYIEDEKMIRVECVGDRNADYDQFLNDLVIIVIFRLGLVYK
jgi:cofilin